MGCGCRALVAGLFTFANGSGLNCGTYKISAEGSGFMVKVSTTTMHVSGFEKIGSAFGAELLVGLGVRTLTIDGVREMSA